MTILEQQPVMLTIPLREDPPGVLRVGNSQVLLDLVLRAYQRGAAPEEIARMYIALDIGDVFAVIAYYLAHRSEVDEYLRQCDEKAAAIRGILEASQPARPDLKEVLIARAKANGMTP